MVIAEPRHNDAVNLKVSIFCFPNATFKSLSCDLFISGAAAVFIYLFFRVAVFSAA